MKLKTKTLSLLLAIVMIFTIAIPALSAQSNSEGFNDVPQSHWAYEPIGRWSDFGVLQGIGDGNFAPERGLTLGELAAILSRTFGYTERENVSVNPAWAASYAQNRLLQAMNSNIRVADASHDAPAGFRATGAHQHDLRFAENFNLDHPLMEGLR